MKPRPHLALLILSLVLLWRPDVAEAAPPRLIVRGDDMGYAHAGNEACIRCFKEGIETSIEVIVASPWFPEAAKLLAENPQVDVGVHLALTAEWDNVKWRPVSAALSLRDEDGFFYPMLHPNKNYPNRALKEHAWKIEDVEQEFRAQIELAKRRIPRVSHISGHMGCDGLSPEVRALVKKLCKEYGLDIFPEEHGVKPFRLGSGAKSSAEERIAAFMKAVDGMENDQTYLLVEHPGLDTPELRGIHHIGYENVAADRQAVTDMLTAPALRRHLDARGVQLIGYKDLRK